jgi:hypothetical protein
LLLWGYCVTITNDSLDLSTLRGVIMKYVSALLFCILFSDVAYCDDILIGQKTYHFNEEPISVYNKGLNNDHYLIGYKRGDYTIIAMENSYYEFSLVGLYTKSTEFNDYIRPFAAIGLATGYEDFVPKQSIGPVTAVGYLGLDLHPKNDRIGIVISWVPQTMIGAGLRIKFN